MTRSTTATRDRWSSRWAFVLAAAGSAIGLGNIWKFPYIAGENGGGAFVLVYLLCIALIGVPVMMSEVLIGRRARRSPISAFEYLAGQMGRTRHWRWLGLIGLSAGFLVLSFYAVIAGWALAYIPKLASGSLVGADAATINATFVALKADPVQLTIWTSVIFVATIGVIAAGVHSGIERSVRWLMPLMFLLLLALVGYAAIKGDFVAGLRFLFEPDFSQLTVGAVLVALGHAFFTLSLAAGIMLMYGAYLPSETSIPKAVVSVAFFDTLVALLAGLAIFPIVFANDLAPGAGPGLIFQTLPIAFATMPGGQWVGTAFFVMLLLAAFASTISLLEVVAVYLMERLGWSRSSAATAMGLVIWLVSFGTVFSFNIGADLTLFGKTFFGLIDYLASNILLPTSGLLLAVFAGWLMRTEDTASELHWSRRDLGYCLWHWVARLVAPTLILVVLVAKLAGAIS